MTLVPLIITRSGQNERMDVYSPTSTIDILPTMMSTTNKPVPDWSEVEILPVFNNRELKTERSIFSIEAKSNPKMDPLNKCGVFLNHQDHKLTRCSAYKIGEENYEIYNIFFARMNEKIVILQTVRKSSIKSI